MKQTRNKNKKNTISCQNLTFPIRINYDNNQFVKESNKIRIITNQEYIDNDK